MCVCVRACVRVCAWQVAPGVFEYVSSPVDEDVKVCVIRDTLRLMDPGLNKQG